MKIEKLHIENYKSIKNIDLNLNGNFNILIGKNNVGKSNLIDSLMFISDITTKWNPEEILASWGGYEQVVFGRNNRNEIVFSLELLLSDIDKQNLFSRLSLKDISFEEFNKDISGRLKYKIKLSNIRGNISVEEVYIDIRGSETLYAKASWENDGMYKTNVIKNFEECYKNGSSSFDMIGGSSPPSRSLIGSTTGHSPTRPAENLLLMLYNFFSSIRKLNPIRESPDKGNARGDYKLEPNARNLPQTLNTLASSKREIFEKINLNVRELIDGITELRAPLTEGAQEVFLSITEQPFNDIEFMWRHVSSGTKEIIYLITLLHTTPKGSLLTIEEPESHLHGDAIYKFISIVDKISKEDDKQFILTTHSPILIDNVPYENLFVVIKNAGKTEIVALKEFSKVDEIMAQAGVPASWILMTHTPSFVFLISGRDDFEIWTQFFIKNGMNPKEQKISIVNCGDGNGGGFGRLIASGKLFKKIRIPIPFMMVEDSDNIKKEKEERLEQDFSTKEFHILSEKEIEDYLIEPEAISKLTNKTIEEVKAAIKTSKSNGKEKLDSIFEKLGMSKPVSQTKAYLVNHIDNIPDEILQIMHKVKEQI